MKFEKYLFSNVKSKIYKTQHYLVYYILNEVNNRLVNKNRIYLYDRKFCIILRSWFMVLK